MKTKMVVVGVQRPSLLSLFVIRDGSSGSSGRSGSGKEREQEVPDVITILSYHYYYYHLTPTPPTTTSHPILSPGLTIQPSSPSSPSLSELGYYNGNSSFLVSKGPRRSSSTALEDIHQVSRGFELTSSYEDIRGIV